MVDAVGARLRSESWSVGQRLPSIRKAALDHGVSKNTMAEAYDRLVAAGLLEVRAGSGYYVVRRDRVPVTSAPQPHVSAAVDLVSLLREQLDKSYAVRPGDGRPPASWMEGSELRRWFTASRAVEGADTFGYGSSYGLAALRERLRVMLLERSIGAAEDGVLLTHGANHALDLIIRHFLRPGDTVLVDDPGYYPLFGKLALAGIRMEGVKRNEDGPDVEELNAKLALGPKAFFTQSQAHNPTGSSLAPSVAFSILQAAERSGMIIVENDAFADIVPPTLTRLAALDQLQRVLYVGTFSKTLSASLRCGFVAGSPPVISVLRDIKMLTTVASSDYVEAFVLGLIERGHYLRHLRRLRARIEKSHLKTLTALEGAGLCVKPPKVPGFYVWAELPPRVDEMELVKAAAERSIFLAPGSLFRPNRIPLERGAIRVNVAYGADQRLIDFLKSALR
ncbi:aminotransferase-like domain-containing protein [Acuticoccus sediminis]|uniref:aminotransferase-like domain-containing protein n=1 Tax=Acuticoccus sediminis TaxID=2184697 RepID=UPI001CFEAEC9|nr:PLP-dependent aminotransferase family protein [Acuticoccus sediminis]